MIYRMTDSSELCAGRKAGDVLHLHRLDASECWIAAPGLPFWINAQAASFVGGMIIERAVIRPVENAPVLAAVVVIDRLAASIFVSVAGWIYSYTVQDFPSPFPDRPVFAYGDDLTWGVIGVTLLMLVLLFAFFRYTPIGLAMRAAAQNPASARLCGISAPAYAGDPLGLAAMIVTAGVMVAPVLFLDPNMMGGVLIYAFAGALLGGITSPIGAVVGGLIVGVTENLVGTYLIASQLKLTVAFALIILVLVFRPNGLFGTAIVRRV